MKTKVSETIVLIKSATYLPFIAKVSPSQSIIAGISVVPAPLSVFPEEIITLVPWVSIWMKLLISLVKIQIFLIAFSHSFLSSITLVVNWVGITSSLSYSGKFP